MSSNISSYSFINVSNINEGYGNRIISSNGFTLKGSNTSTVLSAKIYNSYGEDDVFGTKYAYYWEYFSAKGIWEGLDIGKEITINSGDFIGETIRIRYYYADKEQYGCKFGTYPSHTGSSGIRTLDAVNMVANPSTDSEKGINDFDATAIYGFDLVNGYLDGSSFVTTAVQGTDNSFSLTGSNGDVFSRFRFSCFKYIPENDEWQISNQYIPNTGWCPFGCFISEKNRLKPYVYIARYHASMYNGFLSSVSGLNAACNVEGNLCENTNISYSGQLAEFKKKGNDYCGFTSRELMFLQTLFKIEYATINSQSIMNGNTLNGYQYVPSITETNVERFVVTNGQADPIEINSCVSVGYQYCNSSGGGLSTDRHYKSMSLYANRVIVNKKERLQDGKNTAIYVDNGGVKFSTEPVLHSSGVMLNCYITAMPYKTGRTDSVLGYSGSPSSNSNGRNPMTYRGIENLWGNQFIVLSDVIMKSTYLNNIHKMKAYVCYDSLNFANDITSNYQEVGYDVKCTNAVWEYGTTLGYDINNPSVQIFSDTSTNSSCRYSDGQYTGALNNSLREVLIGGTLNSGSIAGLWLFYLHGGLWSAYWHIASRLSVSGRSHQAS